MTASGAERHAREAIEETAARLFVRLSLDPGPGERAAIDRWIAEDDAHAIAFAKVEAAWCAADRLKAIGCEGFHTGDAAQACDASDFGSGNPKLTRRRLTAGIGVAAMVVLAFPLLPNMGNWQEYATAIGERRDVRLTDGSLLHLNTGTRVLVQMRDDARLIRLDAGEASFDVAHDPARPFDVEVLGTVMRAVGTSFNLRIRERSVELTVAEGIVAVRREARTLDMVNAGAGALVEPEAVIRSPLGTRELDRRTAWRRDMIELNGTSVEQAVAEFNRYRNLPIVINDARVGAMRIGGRFSTGDGDNFVRALEASLPVRSRVEDGRIMLDYRGT